jgi:hypothetical protein
MNQDLINQGVIITSLGESLIENAAISGISLKLQQFSVGDGGSDTFNPTYDELKALTAVPGEWDKRNLIDVYQNPDGAGFIAEGLVPHDVGEGEYCRIAGYWTEDNKLFAVHLIPEWQKPANSGNMLIELPLKAYLTVSDQANITLVIDPSLVQATREYVDRSFLTVAVLASGLGKVNKNHVFMAHGELQLPQGEDGDSLTVSVDLSVSLISGQCRVLPPLGEKIQTKNGQVDVANFIAVNREYRFIKLNGVWRV